MFLSALSMKRAPFDERLLAFLPSIDSSDAVERIDPSPSCQISPLLQSHDE